MSRRLIERYTVAATVPYFALALVLLTAVLLAQQATRFAEILGTARAPLGMAAEIALGLLPNILIFTLPMAVLTGTATGFSRLGSDSELVAMRAAGVGTGRIVLPLVLLGGAVSLLTLYVGLAVAPASARALRETALRAALYRLESPVEPRTFNVELPGKVVYVREGDQETGQWEKVFIQWQEAAGPARLITARSGRIDSSGEETELVLTDAVVTTLPEREDGPAASQITTERSTQLRIRDERLNTGREAVLRRLRERPEDPEELDWRELLQGTRTAADPQERRALSFALHRRLSLCSAPLVFALFGAAVGLRMGRGGRGLGMLLSLATMIAYYLSALACEYLVRVGLLPPALGGWLTTLLALALGLSLLASGRQRAHTLLRFRAGRDAGADSQGKNRREEKRTRPRRTRGGLLAGLLDRAVFGSLAKNFLVALLTLDAIFLVFTLFELLRFIASTGAGASLIARYLLFLTPLAVVALTPMSVLVSVLVTYALLARRSEAVAWWACGQSVYRLAVPGLVFAVCVGAGLWGVQERVLPEANRLQNDLRRRIRGGAARVVTPKGRQWLAASAGHTLYSYEYEEGGAALEKPSVYEFDAEGTHLTRVVFGERGVWEEGRGLTFTGAEVVELGRGGAAGVRRAERESFAGAEPPEVFKPALNTPAEMDAGRLSNYIKALKRRGDRGEVSPLSVALERKKADPFSPLVMALVAIPLALAFGRRSAVAALCAAVAIGLAFWGTTGGLQQMGGRGLLPAAIAVWSPLVIFSAAGLYLLTRART